MNELTIEKKKSYTIRATSCLKRMAQDIIELSQIAHEYHQEFGSQEYIGWIETDLNLSRRYGFSLLNVFDKFGGSANFALNDIAPSALYLLAAPSTPESAREEALELAESGKEVTHKTAKKITDEHKEIDALKVKYAELEAENNALAEKLINQAPTTYELIPSIKELLEIRKIMPAKTKTLSEMTPAGQQAWFSNYLTNLSLENQLQETKSKIQAIQAQTLKAIEEKEDALKQLKGFAGQDNAELISKYENQIALMKDDYDRKILQDRKDIEAQAKALYAKTNKDKIEQAEKEKAAAEKKEKEIREKANAAWKHNDELTRENKKLKSQLEVDKPSNVDNARALKLERELKNLDWVFPDIKAEAQLAGGEMHETKKVIIEIINRWSSLLQDIEGNEIIEINN